MSDIPSPIERKKKVKRRKREVAAPTHQMAAPELPLVQLVDVPPEEEMSENERALYRDAKSKLTGIRDRMLAVQRAAFTFWRPGNDPAAVDESEPAFISDDDYDDLLYVLGKTSEVATIRAIGEFVGLSPALLDDVSQEVLRAAFSPVSGGSKAGTKKGFVVTYKGRGGQHE